MKVFLLVFWGCFTGFFVCTRVGTSIFLIATEWQQAQKAGSAIWPVIMAGIFSSGLWILAGTIAFVWWFFASANPPSWSYPFIKGIGGGPILYGVILAWSLWRLRKVSKPSVQA